MIHLRNNERDHEPEVTMKISLIPLEMGRNITWRIIHRDGGRVWFPSLRSCLCGNKIPTYVLF